MDTERIGRIIGALAVPAIIIWAGLSAGWSGIWTLVLILFVVGAYATNRGS